MKSKVLSERRFLAAPAMRLRSFKAKGAWIEALDCLAAAQQSLGLSRLSCLAQPCCRVVECRRIYWNIHSNLQELQIFPGTCPGSHPRNSVKVSRISMNLLLGAAVAMGQKGWDP